MVYFDNKEFKEDIEFKVYILNKYLIRHYNREVAEKLLKKFSKDLNILARALGEKDIGFFCLYFMSNIFVVKDSNEARQLSSTHYEMWELANDTFIKDKHDKLNIICPRGFAKTTIFDLAISVWLICYGKSKFTLIGAKKDDDAVQFVDSIKKVFKENELIKNTFGELINSKKFKVNANEIEFTNGMYIRAVGSASSVRGANFKGVRPSVVIADDYQDEKDILTDDARTKKYNRWTKEIEQVGDKAVYRNGEKIKAATKIIAIGTVLHIDCLMSKLSRNKEYKTVLKRAIILNDDKTVEDVFESDLWIECKKLYFNDKDEDSKETARDFYIKNKEKMRFSTLWDEKWDCFNDLAIPFWENRISFMSELMNDATSIGVKWFKSVREEHEEFFKDINYSKTMLCIDPASTTNKKSDYTAMVVGSNNSNNFTYIRDIVMKKLEFNSYCKKVVELLETYEDILYVYIEKNTYQGADVIKIKEIISKNIKLRNRRLIWINEMQRKNKDEKISTIIDSVNNGQIIFNKDCEDSKEAIQQLLDFQGQSYSVHDDFPDIVAECANRLKEIKTISKITLLDRSCLF
ncbi:terminase [Clostridium sp.]|uniref:phage terminase large subunit family protein n=1 Tax=Clostridium sp. TaxID=1506 RepID=UPI0029066408|nr:terminase [Clostridium sp.]MDU7364284.1 terminase [Clostridium sp.]